MLIFGTRAVATILATVTLVCARCRTPAANHVVRRVTWFTLFFVRIFPLRRKRYLTCTFCGASSTVSKDQSERLVASAPRPDFAQPYQGQQQYPYTG